MFEEEGKENMSRESRTGSENFRGSFQWSKFSAKFCQITFLSKQNSKLPKWPLLNLGDFYLCFQKSDKETPGMKISLQDRCYDVSPRETIGFIVGSDY